MRAREREKEAGAQPRRAGRLADSAVGINLAVATLTFQCHPLFSFPALSCSPSFLLSHLAPKTPLDTNKHNKVTAPARALGSEATKRPGRRVHSSAVGRFSGARRLRPPLPPPLPSPRLQTRAAEEGRKSGARRTGGSASPLLAPAAPSSATASSSSSCWRRRGGARSPRGFTPTARMKTTAARARTATTTKS